VGDRAQDVRGPQPTLSDGVVWLTHFTAADAVAIGDFNLDEEHRRWFDQPPVDEDADARRRHGEDVARLWMASWSTGEQLDFAVRLSDDGEAIGMAELRPGPDASASMSYAIRPAWRRMGYGSRAVRLLAEAGLERFGFVRIDLRCDVDNVASARTAERASFTFDRVERGAETFEHIAEWAGEPRDERVYSLVALAEGLGSGA
jgi:RimJ/RimL family protein N-acetyltransferase